jgi:WD40 repeat protein
MYYEQPTALPVTQIEPTTTPDTPSEATTVPFLLNPSAATVTPALPRVPGFEILRILGKGGMGIVYLARQEGLNRLVALKMILSGAHADATQRQRFQLEAEAVARLHHPGIVQVHHVGEHDGMPFLVLEYVPGGSLSRYLAGQPQPPALAATWTIALADAVQVAHESGIIHRDLKPGNILLRVEGTGNRDEGIGEERPPAALFPVISDFGLAKDVGVEGESPTATGVVLGTPSYMAPEQAEGRTKELGPAVDIYALGAILYELLTGRPPFRSDRAINTLRQVIADEPVAPRTLNPSVPRDLETICLKCLRKDPDKRYASAREMADDLRRFVAGEPIRARPVGALERGWRWVRRNPVVSGLVVAVVGSLLLGTGVSLYYFGLAVAEAKFAKEKWIAAEKSEHQARLRGYVTAMSYAGVAYRGGNISLVSHLLGQGVPGPGELDLRGPEWPLLQRQARGALQVHEFRALDVRVLAWHPSGEVLYFITDNRLVAREFASGQEIFSVPIPFPQTLIVRPDGKQLAVTAERRLLLFDAATGALLHRSTPAQGTFGALCYRPDGKELSSGNGERSVRRHDPTTGRVLQTFEGHHAFARGIGYVAGSNNIVSLDVYRWLIHWDVATGETLWKTQIGSGSGVPLAMAVHPTRPIAAVGYTWNAPGGKFTGRLELIDLETAQTLADLDGVGGPVRTVSFSPDGEYLATGGDDSIVRIWDVRILLRGGRVPGEKIAELVGHERASGRVAWHPDGWRLASVGDHTLRLWSVRTTTLERAWPALEHGPVILHPRGDSVLLLGGSRPGVRVPLDGPFQRLPIPDLVGAAVNGEWSADGRWLALAMDRHVEIRDGATLRLVHRLPEHLMTLSCVRFTPDGSLLITHDYGGLVEVVETETGQVVRSWRGAVSPAALAVSPSGEFVAVRTGGVILYRIATGEKVWERSSEQAGRYAGIAFLRDGRLIVGCDLGEIHIFEPPRTEPVRRIFSTPVKVVSLWPLADGRRLVTQDHEGSLTFWELDTFEVLRVLPDAAAPENFAIDPDGRWLFRRMDNTLGLWDLRPVDDGLLRRQEALALVDHLAPVSVDRTDLLRRVWEHPAITDAVRAEAIDLAGRYVEDAGSLAWEVFDLACTRNLLPAAYAEQLPRAERVVVERPTDPIAWLARGTLRLRLRQLDDADRDFQAAERLLGERQERERIWLWRLQALRVARARQPDYKAEAEKLRARAEQAVQAQADREKYPRLDARQWVLREELPEAIKYP